MVVIFRGDETVIPRGTTELLPGDEVVALTTPELEERLASAILGRR
jgi:trk system potassium uptake protein